MEDIAKKTGVHLGISSEPIIVEPVPGWKVNDITSVDVASAIDRIAIEDALTAVKREKPPTPTAASASKTVEESEKAFPRGEAVANARLSALIFSGRVKAWPLAVPMTEEALLLFYDRYNGAARSVIKKADKMIEVIKKEELAALLLGANGTTHLGE